MPQTSRKKNLMNWVEVFGSIGTALAVVGVVLNAHQVIVCFWVWMVSNSIGVVIHYRAGLYSMAVRDVFFFGASIYGLIKWSNG